MSFICINYRFGPLTRISAFPFEGMFKFCGSLLHGTRGFGNQLGHHLSIENYLNFQAEQEIPSMKNNRLKTFCKQFFNLHSKSSGLKGNIVPISLGDILGENTNNFINDNSNLDLQMIVSTSSRAIFSNNGIKKIS